MEESDFAEENPLEDEVRFELAPVVADDEGEFGPRSLNTLNFWSMEFFSCEFEGNFPEACL